ncbi:FtsX-like permease family protein [Luteibacter pinisoli]|uniref:FtsX-like permease family protein n=1 Tax=Luteibacter pinisoli TaxID=2589080 RepID=A0A4Y5Z3J4_9GAMM|nr:FtsX-like permease family protein [Luteibacter pinisoli]QDE39970.1 FtsX-like permease family protein [Luteibacter pinisoli]
MFNDIAPILAALKRGRLGAGLLVLQIALTLAIVGNIVFLIGTHTAHLSRPTGVDEPDLFALGYLLDNPGSAHGQREADLAALRRLPAVTDAVATNSYPLRGSGWVEGISLHPGARDIQAQQGNVDLYTFDERGVATLGLRLIEGRDFRQDDITDGSYNRAPLPPVVLITRSIAERLFPGRSALGQTIYLTPEPDHPLRVVGILDRLQTHDAANTTDTATAEDSVVLPLRDHGPRGLYLVRAKPGQLAAAMTAAGAALREANPQRTFGKLRPLSEIRATAYERDRAMAISLTIICAILVFVTALDIVGLTGFWVERRKRQIGIRRALGATRTGVIRYFLIENAMLCGAGVIVGAAAAWALNYALGLRYGVPPLPLWMIAASAIAILTLGQASASFPSTRAARIDPAKAIRAC